MNTYRYPNLTIIDESDIHFIGPNVLDNAVIAKLPESARDAISHQNIRDAIEEQFQVDIQVQNISRYGPDYLILQDSAAATSLILTKGSADVATYTLALMPWTKDYGSTTVPFHTQLPNIQHTHSHSPVAPPNQHLTIQVSGIPPHLCCELIVRCLFSKICVIHQITLNRANLTYWVSAYGPEVFVPSIAHIAVKKTTQNGDILNIWPLWYEVTMSDMHAFINTPNSLPNISECQGDSDLATSHQNEVRVQYYQYADQDDEAASRLRDVAAGNSDSSALPSDWEPYAP